MNPLQPPYKHHRRQGGFTLVELVVVMGVMAILTSIAIPSVLAWMPSMHLKSETTNLKDAFSKARSQAINTGVEHRILIDIANQTYQVDAGNLMNGSTQWATKSGPYHLAADVHVDIPAGMMQSQTTSEQYLRFLSNGSAAGNFDLKSLSLYNNANRHKGYYLGVHRRTGHVTVRKWGA